MTCARHIFTDRPWLAADPTLAPWPDPADAAVFQTGAWILPDDDRPLSPELETFLDAGEPPVYFGFGSMRAPQDLGQVMVDAARALGRRAIVSRGWADLSLVDDRTRLPDHRRGQRAGALPAGRRRRPPRRRGHHDRSRAGRRAAGRHPADLRPALLGRRVQQLGIGTAHAPGAPTAESLTHALARVLDPGVVASARAFAAVVRTDGARVAARRVIEAKGAGFSETQQGLS